MWSRFEHHIDWSFPNTLLLYFYDTKVVQFLYVNYHKLNAMTCFFIFLLTYILNLLSCVYIKKIFHFKTKFGWIIFLFTLTCQHPTICFTTLMKRCKCKRNGVTNVWPPCALFKHIQFLASSRIWVPNHDFVHEPISNIGCVFWSEADGLATLFESFIRLWTWGGWNTY